MAAPARIRSSKLLLPYELAESDEPHAAASSGLYDSRRKSAMPRITRLATAHGVPVVPVSGAHADSCDDGWSHAGWVSLSRTLLAARGNLARLARQERSVFAVAKAFPGDGLDPGGSLRATRAVAAGQGPARCRLQNTVACAVLYLVEFSLLARGADAVIVAVSFRSAVPIYQQIRDQVVEGIAFGLLADGESLPSTRQLAADLAVNFHTVNKAYDLLRQEGFIQLSRKHGAVVTAAADTTQPVPVSADWSARLRTLLAEGRARGMSSAAVIEACRQALELPEESA